MIYSNRKVSMTKQVIKYPSPQGINKAHRPGRVAPRQSEAQSAYSGARLAGKLTAMTLFISGIILFVSSFIDSYSLQGLFNGAILGILGASLWFLSGHEKHVIQHLESQNHNQIRP